MSKSVLKSGLFDRFLVNALMDWIYVIGMVGIIVIAFISSQENAFNVRDVNVEAEFSTVRFLVLAVLGNILWRVGCECMVVLFRIHAVLRDILGELQKRKEVESAE